MGTVMVEVEVTGAGRCAEGGGGGEGEEGRGAGVRGYSDSPDRMTPGHCILRQLRWRWNRTFSPCAYWSDFRIAAGRGTSHRRRHWPNGEADEHRRATGQAGRGATAGDAEGQRPTAYRPTLAMIINARRGQMEGSNGDPANNHRQCGELSMESVAVPPAGIHRTQLHSKPPAGTGKRKTPGVLSRACLIVFVCVCPHLRSQMATAWREQ